MHAIALALSAHVATLPVHLSPGFGGLQPKMTTAKKRPAASLSAFMQAPYSPEAGPQGKGREAISRDRTPKAGDHGPMIITTDGGNGSDPNIIQLPKDAIKTTDKEFTKLDAAMRKDPDAFAQSQMAARNANLPPGADHMMIKIKAGPQAVVNNPIELPDKK